VKVAEQDKHIKSLDAKTRLTDARVGTLTTTVDTDQKELKQLTVDISNESTERVKIFNDLEDTKDKWEKKGAAVEKTIDDNREKATKRMQKLETMLQNQITLSSNQYKLMEERWENETKRTEALDQRLKAEEDKSAELEKNLKHNDEVISKIQQSLTDYATRVEEVYDLLPNATFPNRSSIIHSKLNKLKVQVSQEEDDMKKLRADVDEESSKLSDTSTIVSSLGKTTAQMRSDLNGLSMKVKDMDTAHKKEHAKFHPIYPDPKGFRYTGSGWSYGDRFTKKDIHLGDCLKLCSVKKSMNPAYNGVDFFNYPNGRTVCYCVKGAYGYKANEFAMQFRVD